MKQIKFAVLGSSVLASFGVFLDWIDVSGDLPSAISDGLPRSGMENGGAVFLFLLGMPLLAAGIGCLKRFGRGLAALALFGASLAMLFALAKSADIRHATEKLVEYGFSGTIDLASGYWVLVVGSVVSVVASMAGLVKPEPKLSAGAGAA